MKKIKPFSLHRQTGNLLVTTAIALGVISLFQIGAAKYMVNKASETAGAIAGAQLNDIKEMLGTYITTYHGQLQQPTPAVPGVANPMAPAINELQALGLTNTSVSLTPGLGGQYLTQVTLAPVGCIAPNCNIRAKVWLRDPILSADSNTADLRLLGAAAAVGAGIGFSLPASPTVINSSAGWAEENPDPSKRQGILAAFTGYASSVMAQYLRRDGTSPVTADFPMVGHSITGAKNITASDKISGGTVASSGDITAQGRITAVDNIRTDGNIYANGVIHADRGLVKVKPTAEANTSCLESNGMVTTDANGRVLSCQNRVWKRQSAPTGQYVSLGSYRGVYYGYNNYSDAIVVQVSGGHCDNGRDNGYNLVGMVDGGVVAYSNDNNTEYAKSTYISFYVPAKSNYSISSHPWKCPGGSPFSALAFVFS